TPDGVDAPGVEPLEERNLLRARKGLRGADADARRTEQAPDQPLVRSALADEAEESEVAAQDVPDRLDGRPGHPAPGRVERIVGGVPVGTESEAAQHPVRGRRTGQRSLDRG